MTHSTEQPVLIQALVFKPVQIAFAAPHATCGGSAVLLRAVDERLVSNRVLAKCLREHREPGKFVIR